MKDSKLTEIDGEDLYYFILYTEKSFQLNFGSESFIHVENFGDYCDIVLNTMERKLVHREDCTTQQAFYKLRNEILKNASKSKIEIKPNTLLKDLFPKKERRKKIAAIEKNLGLKLSILNPIPWVKNSLTFFAIIFFLSIFINPFLGILGFLTSILFLKIAYYFGKEFRVNSLKEVVIEMAKENYVKSRRDINTFNKKEIIGILFDSFSSKYLCLGEEKCLSRETRIV